MTIDVHKSFCSAYIVYQFYPRRLEFRSYFNERVDPKAIVSNTFLLRKNNMVSFCMFDIFFY